MFRLHGWSLISDNELIYPCLATCSVSTQAVVFFFLRAIAGNWDKPSSSPLCWRLLERVATTATALAVLNEFLDACSVDFNRGQMSSCTSTVVRVPARFKGAAPFAVCCQDIASLSYTAWAVEGYRLHALSVRTRLTPLNAKSDQYSMWVAILNCYRYAPSVHMSRITWPWTLEPSVICVNSIWSFHIIRRLNIIGL